MREQLSDIARFKHIRDASEEILEFVKGVNEDEFYRNKIIKYAVERCLIVIGEAAKNVSKETIADSRYKEWHKAMGMRNKLVHAYEKTDYTTVYKVATEEIKPLLKEVNEIIAQLEIKFKDEL